MTVNNDGDSEDAASDPISTDVSEDNLAKALELTQLKYDGNSILSQLGTNTTGPGGSYFTVGTAYPSLYDLAYNAHDSSETTQNDLINLADPGSGGKDFLIELTLRSEAGDAFQADGLDVAFEFILNQNDSQ